MWRCSSLQSNREDPADWRRRKTERHPERPGRRNPTSLSPRLRPTARPPARPPTHPPTNPPTPPTPNQSQTQHANNGPRSWPWASSRMSARSWSRRWACTRCGLGALLWGEGGGAFDLLGACEPGVWGFGACGRGPNGKRVFVSFERAQHAQRSCRAAGAPTENQPQSPGPRPPIPPNTSLPRCKDASDPKQCQEVFDMHKSEGILGVRGLCSGGLRAAVASTQLGVNEWVPPRPAALLASRRRRANGGSVNRPREQTNVEKVVDTIGEFSYKPMVGGSGVAASRFQHRIVSSVCRPPPARADSKALIQPQPGPQPPPPPQNSQPPNPPSLHPGGHDRRRRHGRGQGEGSGERADLGDALRSSEGSVVGWLAGCGKAPFRSQGHPRPVPESPARTYRRPPLRPPLRPPAPSPAEHPRPQVRSRPGLHSQARSRGGGRPPLGQPPTAGPTAPMRAARLPLCPVRPPCRPISMEGPAGPGSSGTKKPTPTGPQQKAANATARPLTPHPQLQHPEGGRPADGGARRRLHRLRRRGGGAPRWVGEGV